MAATLGFCIFDTAIGACGIAWNAAGLTGTLLPDSAPERMLATLRRRHPDGDEQPPPPAVEEAIGRIRRLLAGEAVDLQDVALDLDGVTDLNVRIYALTRRIGPGDTRSYGDIARDLGDVRLAQAVGQAMARNPWPIVMPCHRVLASGGKAGGFSAPGGVATKFRILQIEQASRRDEGTLFATLPLAIKPR